MNREDEGHGRTTERFFLADRQVGWITGAASLAATQVSAGTLVGAVGIHYLVGVSFILAWAGIWLGWLFSMHYVAPQLRSSGCVTVPGFFREQFHDGAGGDRIQAFSALLIAAIYLVFTGAQYVAGGVVLETAFGVPPLYGMTALALLALAYTTAGGMWASVATDVLLAVLLLGGLLLSTVVGLARIGGLGALQATITDVDPALLGLNMAVSDLLGFALAFGLALAVAPYEVNRIYAMRDEGTVRKAIAGSIAIQVVIAACIAVLGLLARVQFQGLSNPDAAVVTLITSYFGPIIGGTLLLAVVAAVLSTIDSILLVSASALAYDFYESLVAGGSTREGSSESLDGSGSSPASTTVGSLLIHGFDRRFLPGPFGDATVETGSRRVLRLAQVGTVASGLLPLGLAINSELFGGLVQLIVVLYAALIAGALFVPVVVGIYWDDMSGWAVGAGIAVGTVSVLCWHLLSTTPSGFSPDASVVPPVVVGVASNLLVVGLVSLTLGHE